MHTYTVAVIRGGPTWDPEESKKNGRAVLDALAALGHRTIDVVVDGDAMWVREGRALPPREASRGADVIWNAIVGGYGEDGRAQRDLRSTGLPFTGPTDLAAAMSTQKHHAKEVLRRAGVRTPVARVVERGDSMAMAPELFRVCPMPAIVKPADRGGSMGVSVARTIPELALALEAAFAISPKAIIEEWIDGREATVGIVDGFRGEARYALPTVEVCIESAGIWDATGADVSESLVGCDPLGTAARSREVASSCRGQAVGDSLGARSPRAGLASTPKFRRIPRDCRHYTCDMKKTGQGAKLVCPGSFDGKSREEIYAAARAAHDALGLRDVSRIDIIHHPRRGAYVIEANAVPSVAPGSPVWRSLVAVGADLKQLVEHVIRRALEERR